MLKPSACFCINMEDTMSKYNPAEYSFHGLCRDGKSRPQAKSLNSLIYVIGLVDSINNKAASLRWVNANLPPIYDVEEQIQDAPDLLSWQREILPSGYFPQTPCMLTLAWSPSQPCWSRVLNPLCYDAIRMGRLVPQASGSPSLLKVPATLMMPRIFEQLFWAILSEAFHRAKERKMLISIIAKPGWSYQTAPGPCPNGTRTKSLKQIRYFGNGFRKINSE